ncbi:MAG TPA: hypothetical protein ENN40_10605 [Candidatus Aminicenantes bacterium]|nr:hypothetical protein [Candidatus Aminicenantes bacterium]
MNGDVFRFRHILVKDLKCTVNRLPMLLGLYGIYFLLAWFSLREVESAFLSSESLRTLFWPAFLIQTAFVITVMLMPQYVYAESMREKHETYFAYGYSTVDIVVGKSVMIVLLSLVPALIFSLIAFPELTPRGARLPAFLFAVGAGVFGLVSLIVFLVWFSRMGRFAVVLLILLMVISFSRSQSLIAMATTVSAGGLTLVLTAAGTLLFVIFIFSAWLGNRETYILKR